jgi:hypothetical protein
MTSGIEPATFRLLRAPLVLQADNNVMEEHNASIFTVLASKLKVSIPKMEEIHSSYNLDIN